MNEQKLRCIVDGTNNKFQRRWRQKRDVCLALYIVKSVFGGLNSEKRTGAGKYIAEVLA